MTSTSFINNSFDSARTALDNLDQYVASITGSTSKIDLDVESSESDGAPELLIKLNQRTLFCQTIPAGKHKYTLDLDVAKHNVLSVSMTNKLPNDTKVVNGEIVADKWIKINQLSIDNYNLVTDYDFFKHYFKYVSQGQPCEPMPGFWHNSELILEFDSPFALWYVDRTNANVSIANELSFRTVEQLSITDLENRLLDYLSGLKY